LIERTQQLVLLRQKIDRLRADADLDALTGLANRRRFRVALAREVERWRRYRVPCALLMLDIDHLKRINDEFGHPAGDLVIRQIAQTLREVSRDNDTAARLGGEEFALLLAGVDLERAAAAAGRLRSVLSGKRVEGVGTVTVSIGVAGCPESATSERALYSASDQALYVSKNSGRDRVSIAPPLQEKCLVSEMQPDSLGHWGKYGGRFVPETLMAPLEELTDAYLASRDDDDFQSELQSLLQTLRRPAHAALSRGAPDRTRRRRKDLSQARRSPPHGRAQNQ
jgi:diguanylate cyclase (GGDEF)-like protein